MSLERTAFVFIGYQNDYFASDGILRSVIAESDRTGDVLKNTLALIDKLQHTDATLVQTPIIFTHDYSELVEPVGILKAIRDVEAFKEGTRGADVIDAFKAYGDRIETVQGKRGLNAFSSTRLDEVLSGHDIEHVVLAGAVTSICIDSTGRSAHERGYRVSVLSDCTASRTPLEQSFYCEHVFPLYAELTNTQAVLEHAGAG